LSQRKIALIANLTSNNSRNQFKFDRFVYDRLVNSGIEVSLFQTSSLEDLKKKVKESLDNDVNEFVSIGGDGSLHHLVNQLFSQVKDISKLKLAILPKGTGNDYARNFNFKSKRDILQAIIAQQYKKVDIGLLSYTHGDKHFINMLGLGFSAAVVKKLNRYKWLGGMSYYLALIDTFFSYQAEKIELTIDDQAHSWDCFQLSIGIGKYAGNNMKLCPQAIIDDGLFDMNIIEKVSLWKLLRYLHTLKDGSYLNHIPSKSFKARSIQLLHTSNLDCEADGEEMACPQKVTILEKRILMPTTSN
jgi:diacylglycerol kinase (ATP)